MGRPGGELERGGDRDEGGLTYDQFNKTVALHSSMAEQLALMG